MNVCFSRISVQCFGHLLQENHVLFVEIISMRVFWWFWHHRQEGIFVIFITVVPCSRIGVVIFSKSLMWHRPSRCQLVMHFQDLFSWILLCESLSHLIVISHISDYFVILCLVCFRYEGCHSGLYHTSLYLR